MRRVVAGLAMSAALLLCGCDTELYANLPEREANAMLAALDDQGIPATRVQQEDGRIAIHVDKGKFAEAVRVLEGAGLPHRQFESMGQVFKRDGLVVSPTQERAQMLYALSEELSETVSEIDGVVSARVHVVLPSSDPLRRDAQPSSASVFIRHEPGLAVGPLVPRIKSLVAGSVAGLSYDRVSVVTVAVPGEAASGSDGRLVHFMGLAMAPSSVTRAGWTFGLLGVLAAAFGAVAAAFVLRRQQAETYKLASPS